MSKVFDFLVIGGGIAGVSVGSELAARGTVLLAEMEPQLAYHTTGRSAAISMESYGNATIRALTKVSTAFYKSAESDFSDVPLWSERGALILADANSQHHLERRFEAVTEIVPDANLLSSSQICTMVPYLRPERWTLGLYEPSAFDLDVHAIHSAYLRVFRRRSGEILRSTQVAELRRNAQFWEAKFTDGSNIQAGYFVNAAGAWADKVATLAGIDPVGLRPLRRTVATVDQVHDYSQTPYIGTVDEELFIKPTAGSFMVSPCDETLSEPCDAWPEDMDIAIAIDRFEQATKLSVARVKHSWAGLRSFVPDRSPVVGPDDRAENFAWFAALGGYGIQTTPALSALCAALICGEGIAPKLIELGMRPGDILPGRCRTSQFVDQDIEKVAELC